jgi:FAD/FMN-containing dehydrogenase
VDGERHPDLFWALRGGGGDFGVVTRFRYRLHPIADLVGRRPYPSMYELLPDAPASVTNVTYSFAADEDRLHETYPDGTYQRLVEAKRRYDPGNRFRRNLNIRPAETSAPP